MNNEQLGMLVLLCCKALSSADMVEFKAFISTLIHSYAEDNDLDSITLANDTIQEFEEFEDLWNSLPDSEKGGN